MKLEWSLRKVRTLAPLLVGLWLIFSCSTPESSQEGSETHFLTSCDATCAEGMQCLCGVCTKSCSEQTDCANFAGVASCAPLGPRVAAQRCAPSESSAICDAACLSDVDCSKLAADRVCDYGYCRELRHQAPPSAACMPPKLASADVLILGDVLIELSIFAEQLEQAAVMTGNLSAGQHYRNEAAGGSSLLATGPQSIDSEYTKGLAQGPARVIVMNGGATDVLKGQCAGMLTPDCPAAHAAVMGAEQLFERFAKDGVEHVVYFFYGDPVGNPTLKDGLDLMRGLLRNACGRSPVPCHWLDLRPTFARHPEYVGVEGLVFTDAGASAAAAATFAFMQEQCVAN
ncbi:MAG TPA: hypothetical protein VJV79_22120 [Polyangiaceae bacterium]|nr:hypothetical protein [Polyangiaceae bacterium]